MILFQSNTPMAQIDTQNKYHGQVAQALAQTCGRRGIPIADSCSCGKHPPWSDMFVQEGEWMAT